MTVSAHPDLAAALEDELAAAVELRRALHRDPRLGGEEEDTLAQVARALDGTGEVTGVAGTGGLLRVGPPADGGDGVPAVAVRAELDALPITERTGLEFSSRRPGVAHVCGHDVHTAALVALTRAVARVGPEVLPAPLLAVFQPREEAAPSGAADIADAPVFRDHHAGAVLAVHVQPELPRGVVSSRPGPVNASSDEIEIVVRGRAGHGGYPHRTLDPVPALAAIVVDLQHVVARRVNPLTAGVVTIGQLTAGSAPNVVPETATARGTVRALDADRDAIHAVLRDVVEHVAAAHGCTGEITVVPNEDAVVNDEALALAVADALRGGAADDPPVPGAAGDGGDGGGAGAPAAPEAGPVLDTTFRSCGADDFAHYGAVLPCLMLFVGAADPGTAPGSGPGLHHPSFSPDDAMVGEVARALLTAVVAAGHALRAAPSPQETPA